jgi:hypothetical protein
VTPHEIIRRQMANDARNIRDVCRFHMHDQHARVIADCAVRLLEAMELQYTTEIEEAALENLRRAVEGWRA